MRLIIIHYRITEGIGNTIMMLYKNIRSMVRSPKRGIHYKIFRQLVGNIVTLKHFLSCCNGIPPVNLLYFRQVARK